jgi:hypothetical protein
MAMKDTQPMHFDAVDEDFGKSMAGNTRKSQHGPLEIE